MNHKPEQIDQIFRDRLHDAAPPPPAFVWDNIEAELRKRRRRFFFWIFSIGIAAGGLLTLWQSDAVPFGSREEVSLQQPSGVSETDRESVTDRAPAQTSGSESTSLEVEAEPATRSFTAKKAQTTAAPSLQPLTATPVVPANPDPVVIAENEPDFTPEKATPAVSRNNLSTALLPVSLLYPERRGGISGGLLDRAWPKPLMPKKHKPGTKKPLRNCYDFSRQPATWLLEAYLGPDLSQRSFVTTHDNQPYLNKRLNSEKQDRSFNAGVRASVMLNGAFLIRTGINYDQAVEVFEYIDPDEVITDVRHVYDPATGQTRLDTVGIYYGEKYQKTFNRYGFLDIPLTLGVELRKGASGFNINAGMSFNFLFWKRGAILSPTTNTPAYFTPGKPYGLPVFKDKAGMSAVVSMQWFYHINPRWRIFVEPSYRKILRPVSLPDHPVQQSYGFGSLRLGCATILN